MSEVRDINWYIRRWKGRGWYISKLIRENEALERENSRLKDKVRKLSRA